VVVVHDDALAPCEVPDQRRQLPLRVAVMKHGQKWQVVLMRQVRRVGISQHGERWQQLVSDTHERRGGPGYPTGVIS
jgi:hypothetical protein